MTKTLAVTTSTATADDTVSTPGTLVMRDSQGGITTANVAAASLSLSGTFSGAVSAKTVSFTAAAATHYLCDATAGAITVTLPLASASAGLVYVFVKTDASGNAITLTGASGTNTTSTRWAKIVAICDGSTWYAV